MEFLCQDYTLQYSYAIPFHVKLADSWLWMSNSTSCEFVLNRLVKIWPPRLLCVNVRALFPVSILQFWQIHGGENEGLVGYRTRERRKECLLEWVFCRQKLTFYWRKVVPIKKKNFFFHSNRKFWILHNDFHLVTERIVPEIWVNFGFMAS